MKQEGEYGQQKYQPTQTSVQYFNDNGDEGSWSGNFFSSFLYQDHVTKHKCEYSKLQSSKKVKTQGEETNVNNTAFIEEINLMKIIRQNRNKKLLESYKTKKPKIVKDENQQYKSVQEMKKLKRKIRGQVLSLNHDFLREYLYHQQPFNEMLGQINKFQSEKNVNEKRIEDLKSRITKCIEKRKQIKRNFDKQELPFQKKKVQLNKSSKQFYENEIDKKFETIWKQVRKDIGDKIRMEGQFNLYNSRIKFQV